MTYPRTVSSLIGPWGIVILVVILFLVYGPKRISTMGRSFGRGKREFIDSVTGKNQSRPGELPPAPEPTKSASPTSEPDAD
jgi:sec-independent protein translocase protein TatA